MDLEEVKPEVEEILEKKKDDVNPWKEFVNLCKDAGSSHYEVISKLAWYYLEETGGVDVDDPVTQVKELASAISEIEGAISKITEPPGLKRLKRYKEVIKEMKETKELIEGMKSKKLTAEDLIYILKKVM